jgi:hypothetical protein
MPEPSKGFRYHFSSAFTSRRNAIHSRKADFLSRRPHRSFRLTHPRDARRSLKLPGYVAFTHEVNVTLRRNWRMFALLGVVYGVLNVALIGIGSQETYATLLSTLQETSEEVFQGDIGQVGEASILFLSVAATGLTGELTEAQQLYASLIGLLVWLTTVWLLRQRLAGRKVKLRDGLYNAGAPLVATFLVVLVLVVQLLPLALALIGYGAATATGLLEGGVEAMLFWAAFALLSALSLFWLTATFFALIIVTLPGTYPMQALRIAGDLVVSRRLRIIYRLLWMFLVVAVVWALILIPVILFDGWIKSVWPAIESLPIVPGALLFMGTASIIWAASYVYLLYRKVVEDDALPA